MGDFVHSKVFEAETEPEQKRPKTSDIRDLFRRQDRKEEQAEARIKKDTRIRLYETNPEEDNSNMEADPRA